MIKKIIYIIIAFLALVIIIIGGLLSFVSPNIFKPIIIKEVKKTTGLTLVINGKLSWKLFPEFGIKIGQTELINPNGFSGDILSFNNANLSLKILPLLTHHLDIKAISLINLKANSITNKSGQNNLSEIISNLKSASVKTSFSANNSSNLSKDNNLKSSQTIKNDNTKNLVTNHSQNNQNSAPNKSKVSSNSSWKITLGNFKVQNASLNIINQNTDSIITFSNINLSLNNFKINQDNSLSYSFNASLNKQILFKDVGNLNFNISSNYSTISLDIVKNNISLTGINSLKPITGNITLNSVINLNSSTIDISKFNADINKNTLGGNIYINYKSIPIITYKFFSEKMNLNMFLKGLDQNLKPIIAQDLPISENISNSSNFNSEYSVAPSIPNISPSSNSNLSKENSTNLIDINFLNDFNLKGSFIINNLQYSSLLLTNLDVETNLNDGILNITQQKAKFEGGILNTYINLNAKSPIPVYNFKAELNNISIGSLVESFSSKKLIDGFSNLNINLSGSGLSQRDLYNNSKGEVSFNISNGFLYGVNITGIVSKLKNTLNSKSNLLSLETIQNLQSLYSSLKTTYISQNDSTHFAILKGGFKLSDGVISTSNIKLQSKVLNVLGAGQANLNTQEIGVALNANYPGNKIIVPLTIKGTWLKPSYGVNLETILSHDIASKTLTAAVSKVTNLFNLFK